MREAERRLIILFSESERKSDGVIDILTDFIEADRAEQKNDARLRDAALYEDWRKWREGAESKSDFEFDAELAEHFDNRMVFEDEKTAALQMAHSGWVNSGSTENFSRLMFAVTDLLEGDK